MVKIRLARGGRIHHPVYTIVATDSRNPRDGRFLAKLGQYDPMSNKEVLLDVNTELISEYISKGAVLSSTLKSLFKKNKVSVNKVSVS